MNDSATMASAHGIAVYCKPISRACMFVFLRGIIYPSITTFMAQYGIILRYALYLNPPKFRKQSCTYILFLQYSYATEYT